MKLEAKMPQSLGQVHSSPLIVTSMISHFGYIPRNKVVVDSCNWLIHTCYTLMCTLRGSLHYVGQLERSLSKLLLRGEERSPLKYIKSGILSNFEYFIEKKFHVLTRVWISILGGPKLLPRGQTLSTKSAKKLPCRHFGGLSPLQFDH